MSKPIDYKPMDDASIARLLRELEQPVEPDRRYAERLYTVVRREAVRRRPTTIYMLAAAALLTTALIGLAIVGAGRMPIENDRVAVVGPSPAATPAPSLAPESPTPRPLPAFTQTDVLQVDSDLPITIGSSEDAVWLGQSISDGAEGTLIRVDANDESVERLPVSPDGTASAVYLREPLVGSSTLRIGIETLNQSGSSNAFWLLSADPNSTADASSDELSVFYDAFGLDEVDQLWGANRFGTSTLDDAGEVIDTVRHPWGSADRDNWYNSVAPAPAFGSLWAHEAGIPAVHRVDPVTGDVLATIPLTHCEPGGSDHYGYHPALIYPLYGVDGLPDVIVASCSMDGSTHAYDGSMALIDPGTDEVLGVVEVGDSFGRGAVLNGRWYVPVMPAEGGEAGHVALIDAPSLGTAATFSIVGGLKPGGLVAAGDSLWVVASNAEEDPGTYHLVRMQPEVEL